MWFSHSCSHLAFPLIQAFKELYNELRKSWLLSVLLLRNRLHCAHTSVTQQSWNLFTAIKAYLQPIRKLKILLIFPQYKADCHCTSHQIRYPAKGTYRLLHSVLSQHWIWQSLIKESLCKYGNIQSKNICIKNSVLQTNIVQIDLCRYWTIPSHFPGFLQYIPGTPILLSSSTEQSHLYKYVYIYISTIFSHLNWKLQSKN